MFYSPKKKSVPTFYGGIKMRSVLEVKWAVYLDLIGLKWLYEPAKFKIPKEKSYTPDFFLPEIQLYLEVKPEHYEWEPKHQEFVRYYKYPIAVCLGEPGMQRQKYMMFEGDLLKSGDAHLFAKRNPCPETVESNWFLKIMWTEVQNFRIIGGGQNQRAQKLYYYNIEQIYHEYIRQGVPCAMKFPLSPNQCPRCRKYNTIECDERIERPYCFHCGWNRI